MQPSTRPALLYLVHRVPYPPDKGDRIRAFHLLRFLSKHADVHLAALADEPVPPATVAALERYCARVAAVPLGPTRWAWALGSLARGGTVTEGAFHSPTLRKVLGSWAGDTRFQSALASASSMVPYLLMPELRDVPAVADLVDVDSQKWLEYAADRRGPRAWLYRTEGKRLRRLENALPERFRAITLVSEAEADLYRQFCNRGQVHGIVNGVDLDYFQPQPQASAAGCVFVGALDYRPNVEGIVWFCDHVWPQIRQLQPGATIALVGRRPVPAVTRLARVPGVEVVGQVPDVRPYVARAAVAVVPLQIARGVQNKVLEALAMAKAVVASPQSLVGLSAQPGVHLLEASSAQEWVKAVVSLLEDPAPRQQLGSAGRRHVESHHQWDRCLEPFGPLLGLTSSLPASTNGDGSAQDAVSFADKGKSP